MKNKRWKNGTLPTGNANYAWNQHMIHHLAPNGKIGLVLANGMLPTQSSGEDNIGKNIITMPMQLSTVLRFKLHCGLLQKARKLSGKTLFIDVRTVWKIVDIRY